MNELESVPDLLSNLAHEFAERYRRGERPDPNEYAERYPELAEQIRELFPALAMMEQFGSVAGEAPKGEVAGVAAVPRQLGEYRILREIGRGGMGVVYEAVQESLGRHVALKVLPLHHLMTPTHLERFEREAKAAARLHHTNIVPVFGIGVHEGVHYYAMQFIQGQALDTVLHEVRHLRGDADRSRGPLTASIAKGLATGGLTLEARDSAESPPTSLVTSSSSAAPPSHPGGGQSELTGSSEARYFAGVARVGIQVAEALAYAHGQGMVHRDIKPSNLLLDTQGITWITDFGLVKDESGSDLTTPGDIVGTIRYMAPERFRDQGDARSDIYSLGATLYEMLTLKPAFPGEQRAELMDRVRHEEPRRPRQIDARIPRDLETVVLKAIAKEADRRYQTASALAEDLRRYLADRPVLARRSTTAEQVWRWCRRNPTVAILTSSVIVLLMVLLAGAWVSNARLEEQLEETRKAEREKTALLERTKLAEEEKTDKLWDSYLASAQASRWSGRPGRRFDGLNAVRNAAAIRTDLRLRNEAIALLMLPDVRIAKKIPGGLPPDCAALCFDPNFEHYARSDLKGNISVRRVAGDQEVKCLEGFGVHAWRMKFSPDGRFLLALYADPGARHRIWEWSVARVVLEAPIVGHIDFSPDSAIAAMGQRDGIAIHELTDGKVIKHLKLDPSKSGHSAWFHPDGRLIAVDSREPPRLDIIEWETGNVIARLPAEAATWHPGGTRLVLVGPKAMTVWDARTWTAEKPLISPDGDPNQARFSPRDDLLATGGQYDGRLRLWDPTTGRQHLSLHGDFLGAPQFSRNGALLAATRDGAAIHIWELAASREYRFLRAPPPPHDTTWTIDFSPDGQLLVTAGAGGARLWDVARGRDLAHLPTGMCSGAVFAPDGKALYTRSAAGVQRWPLRSAKVSGPFAANTGHPPAGKDPDTFIDLAIGPPDAIAQLPLTGHTGTLVAAPDGKLAANLRAEGTVLLFDPADPGNAVQLPDHVGSTNRLAVSADGRWVATRSWWDRPDKLRVSDVRTGKLVRTDTLKFGGAEFSPDSRWLVTGGDACRIWETGTWRLERTIEPPPGLGDVVYAAFAPDGITLAIGHENRVVRLVDARTGDELAILPAPDLPAIDRLCFSPDGSTLACIVEAIGVQIWDLRGLRAQLADMNLDWSLPAYPPPSAATPRHPIRARVVTTPPAAVKVATPRNVGLLHRLALLEFLTVVTPYHPEPFHQRGHAREALGRHQEAIADYGRALVWQPSAAHLYADRGRNYDLIKDRASAVRDLEKAVALAPGYAYALNALAWFYVTGPADTHAPARAVPLAQRAVQLAPGNAAYRNTLGVAFYRAGEFGQAIDILDANTKDRSNADAGIDLLFLAMSHKQRGDSMQARACYERARAWQQSAKLTGARLDAWNTFCAEADATLAVNPER
jgi:serine/threonine protein kinase/WD40 repeat protein